MQRRRMYRSGMGFAFWRWTDITVDGKLYLRRLHLIQVPRLGAVMLHWILRPDPQRDLHDHPVSFLSILLRGYYYEDRAIPDRGCDEPDAPRLVRQQFIHFINYVRATDRHRISGLPLGGCLTLVFAGPKVRDWGFWTPVGFVPWREYNEKGDGTSSKNLEADPRNYEDK